MANKDYEQTSMANIRRWEYAWNDLEQSNTFRKSVSPVLCMQKMPRMCPTFQDFQGKREEVATFRSVSQ